MRWARIGLGVGLPAAVGLASAAAYLLVLWLPEADPRVVEWPDILLIIVPPVVVASLLRRLPAAHRVAAAAAGIAVGLGATFLGAVVLFVAGSS